MAWVRLREGETASAEELPTFLSSSTAASRCPRPTLLSATCFHLSQVSSAATACRHRTRTRRNDSTRGAKSSIRPMARRPRHGGTSTSPAGPAALPVAAADAGAAGVQRSAAHPGTPGHHARRAADHRHSRGFGPAGRWRHRLHARADHHPGPSGAAAPGLRVLRGDRNRRRERAALRGADGVLHARARQAPEVFQRILSAPQRAAGSA